MNNSAGDSDRELELNEKPELTETENAQSSEVVRKDKKVPLINQWHNHLYDGSLDLCNRGLDHIPIAIFDYYQQITIVYLQDNRIKEMPENFFDSLPSLAWCDLRFNELEVLTNFSKSHNSLRVLMLQDNRLKTLPYSLGIYAVNLKTLGLRGNPFHDPPQEVLNAGTDAIRMYLSHNGKRENIRNDFVESDREENKSIACSGRKRDKNIPSLRIFNKRTNNKDVPNFVKSLYNSVTRARKTQSQVWSKNTSRHSSIFGNMDNKTASNITYTNDVWRDIPYDGYSQKELINKSLEEMRSHIIKKFSIQRDKILQRIKDREVLTRWRFETRELQQAGRRPGICSLIPPYGVTKDVVQEDDDLHLSKSLEYVHMSPESFQREVSDCSKKLQHFINNPTPITDTEAAYRRLQEVEEIQRKLCSMKLSVKCPTPV